MIPSAVTSVCLLLCAFVKTHLFFTLLPSYYLALFILPGSSAHVPKMLSKRSVIAKFCSGPSAMSSWIRIYVNID